MGNSLFNKHGETLKKPIVESGGFIIDLEEHDYLRVKLPPHPCALAGLW
ncbi:MAG: hypothetical protein LBD79_10070 [Treponema sp.]|nr:hypothetical protein [Treponema sp.]